MSKTVILGAGPAGLSCANRLIEHGQTSLVIEKARAVGGLTRTIVAGDFRFDLGGHRFYTKNPMVQAFVDDLLGEELLHVQRLSRIHFRGRYVDYPIQPWNALWNVGPTTSLRILRDLLALRWRANSSPPRSLEDWMLQSYGRTLYETYFKVYATKVWGLPADQIHVDLAAQRVKGLRLADIVRQALYRTKAERESMEKVFRYPRLGFGRLCDAMAERLARENLALETTPIRIAHDGHRILEVEVRDGEGQESTHSIEHLVSSIPVTTLVDLLDPGPPDRVRAAAARLGHRAVVFVAVFLDQPAVRPESWIYFPSPELSFGRITEPRNWSPAMSPDGKTSLVAEHFCDEGDAIWSFPDEALAQRTIEDLTGRLCLFDRSRVIGWKVVRAGRAYPRMDVDHKMHLQVIEEHLGRFANLQLIGRAGMYRYHNTDHVLETGLLAAENIRAGRAKYDLRTVNAELTYHETGKTS